MTYPANNAQLLSVAREAALEAGALARRMFSEPLAVSSKGRRDIVTDADLAAQKIITDAILEAFPEHGFMPEEASADLPDSGPILWIIDPIDGTVNYSRGVPSFCVAIAAVRNEAPLDMGHVLAAVVYDPMLDELFTATAGGPALLEEKGLHGRLLRTSSVANLENALVGIDWPLADEARQEALAYAGRLGPQINVFRTLGSAVLTMAWVAAGRLEGYINYQLKPWDVAAAGLLVRQAGGTMSDLAGQPLRLDPSGMSCLAANAHLAPHLRARP